MFETHYIATDGAICAQMPNNLHHVRRWESEAHEKRRGGNESCGKVTCADEGVHGLRYIRKIKNIQESSLHGISINLMKDAKCRDPGSNRGPSDLQSDALPAELSRLVQNVVALR